MKKFTLLALSLLIAVFSASATDVTGKTGDYTVTNNEIITGNASGLRIIVPSGYTIQLGACDVSGRNVSTGAQGAAIYLSGSATIKIQTGVTARLWNGHVNSPAIYVPTGNTLTIEGMGTTYSNSLLYAQANNKSGTNYGAGIGAGKNTACGNINIGRYCTVLAQGGDYGAAIGGAYEAGYGKIVIDGKSRVVATRGSLATCAIGKGYNATTAGIVSIATRTMPDITSRDYEYTPWDGNLANFPSTGEVVALNGTTITGAYYYNQHGSGKRIYIESGAVIKLSDVDIIADNNALTCIGDAGVKLIGSNSLQAGSGYAGIFIPVDKKLTITTDETSVNQGNGALYVEGGSGAPALGTDAAALGGSIEIRKGYIEAQGGSGAPAIGAGAGAYGATCQDITILSTVTYLKATAGYNALYSIGRSDVSVCGTITVAGEVIASTTENPYYYPYVWDGNLSTVTKDVVAQNNTIITGTLSTNHKVTIAAGAHVALQDARINGSGNYAPEGGYSAITCEGNATIYVNGQNYLKSFHSNYPAIFVPDGKTLTIDAEGTGYHILEARGSGNAAGIGAGRNTGAAGAIVINGGEIKAYGGTEGNGSGAGIGASYYQACDNIYLNGGSILAVGSGKSSGIGSGDGGRSEQIWISHNVEEVTATCASVDANCIGKSKDIGPVSGGCAGVYFEKGLNDWKNVSDKVNGLESSFKFVYKPMALDTCYTKLVNEIAEVQNYVAAYDDYYPSLLSTLKGYLGECKQDILDHFYHSEWLLDDYARLHDSYITTAQAVQAQDDIIVKAKAALENLISEANIVLADLYGTDAGYPLYVAILAAQEVLNDEYATAEQIETTRQALANALAEAKAQGIEDVLDGNAVRTKVIRDGQLFILVGDKTYDAQGKEIK